MELIYAYKDYKVIADRIDEIEKETNAIIGAKEGESDWPRYHALWDERYKLEEQIDKMRPQLIPEVGMPCTVYWFSDSSGAHIEKIISPKCVQVKCDGLYHCTKTFTHRKTGRWVEKHTTSRDPGTTLALGYRHDYFDESF